MPCSRAEARGADEELLWLPGLADPVHLDDDHAFAADVGQVDEHQRASLDGAQPRRLASNSRPSRKIIDSRTASSSATWPIAARAAGDSPSSRSSVTGSQCQSGTRDLAVGRLDDLGGFPDCLVPDSGVGVGEGSFGGVEPGGDRGPRPDGDGGAPALVEVADGEDGRYCLRRQPG